MTELSMSPCNCKDKTHCKHDCCKRGLKPLTPPPAPFVPAGMPAGLTNMKDQVYFTLHQGMMAKYRSGNLEAFEDAERLLLVCSESRTNFSHI